MSGAGRATSISQLERVWLSSRQLAVHYRERRRLIELYERRWGELTELAAAASADGVGAEPFLPGGELLCVG